MHIKLAPELNQAMNIMKYSVNHSWKFDYYRIAFFAGFLQAIMVISVEVINFVNLLLTNQILEIVMNFLALVIIAEFDDFFYEVYPNEDLKALIKKKMYRHLLIIQTTTSKDADKLLTSHRLENYYQKADKKILDEQTKKKHMP